MVKIKETDRQADRQTNTKWQRAEVYQKGRMFLGNVCCSALAVGSASLFIYRSGSSRTDSRLKFNDVCFENRLCADHFLQLLFLCWVGARTPLVCGRCKEEQEKEDGGSSSGRGGKQVRPCQHRGTNVSSRTLSGLTVLSLFAFDIWTGSLIAFTHQCGVPIRLGSHDYRR